MSLYKEWIALIENSDLDLMGFAGMIHAWSLANVAYIMEERGRDDWKSPRKLLEDSEGDCEDFAILAYASLRKHGLAPSNVRITYIYTNQGAHMTCRFRDEDGTWWEMDNLKDKLAEPRSRAIYQISEEGFFVRNMLMSGRVYKWEGAVKEMQEDGILSGRIIWSNPAETGTVPSSWDITDDTTLE